MLKEILIGMFVLICITSGTAADMLDIQLKITKNDEVSLVNMNLINGMKSADKVPGDYKLFIKDSNDNILWQDSLKLNFFIMTDPPQPIDEVPLNLRIPYTDNMSTLELSKSGEILFTTEIILCNGNGVCEKYENAISCNIDCSIREVDGICINEIDNICDPDCSEGADPDCDVLDSCGDKVCVGDENYILCPDDCASGQDDGICDSVNDGICDPDCNMMSDIDCRIVCGDNICSDGEKCAADCRKENSDLEPCIKNGICELNCELDSDCNNSKSILPKILIMVLLTVLVIGITIIVIKRKNEKRA